MKVGLYGLGMALIVASLVAPVSAGTPVGVPEIDGASITAGLGLLAGGVLLVRARFRR
jgi:hypothetical protein